MPSSGSSNYTVNRNDIIKEAYELGGITRTGQTLSSSQITKGSNTLNAMVKAWGASGIRLWTVAEGILIPQSDQRQYALGTGSTDHAALFSDFVKSTLSADEASGQTVLGVTSTTGMANADVVGIQLDDGTIHFSTISGAPTATTITIALALTDSAASGAVVMTYTNKITRPLKIVSMRRYALSDAIETPMLPSARLDYQSMSNKATDGLPTQFFYDPALSLGQLYLWPRENVVTSALRFTFYRPIEDFDTAADNPDLPQEWIKAINLGLALDLGMSFNIPEQRYGRIKEQLANVMAALVGHDREEESLFMSPDFS